MSSGNVEKKKEFIVYKRRKGTTSEEKALSQPTEDIPLPSKSALGSDEGKVDREIGEDGNYYECDICFDGGDLLCCESCPGAYHLECLSLKSVPDGPWKCPKCSSDGDSNPKGNSSKKAEGNKKK